MNRAEYEAHLLELKAKRELKKRLAGLRGLERMRAARFTEVEVTAGFLWRVLP